jgi:prephenate dehydrogenase
MKIAIIGMGKMGSWLAAQLAKQNEVAAYDRHPERAGAINGVRALKSLPELSAFAPELLINAVTLSGTIPAFEAAIPHLQKTCVLCDVASVKGGLAEYYAKSGFKFVSVHPMFGPTFANLESLHEENAVIISESEQHMAELFRRFFSGLGVAIYNYSFREHDEMMAYSLTTPFVSSLVFASCMDKGAVPGATFARHKKIAQGLLSEDDSLLSEVLFNQYSLRQLERITSKLEFIKHVIKGRDSEEAKRYFASLRRNLGQTK